MTARAIAVSMGLLLALPALGAAQGLGDAAAREKQKREKAAGRKEAVRLITNADLDEGRPAEEKKGEEAASVSASGGVVDEEPSPSPVVDRGAGLRPFVDAVGAAQARADSVEARIRELNGKLNPMSTTFIYGAGGSNSANEEAQVRDELRRAEAELAEARRELAAANENLQAARQGRVPQRRE